MEIRRPNQSSAGGFPVVQAESVVRSVPVCKAGAMTTTAVPKKLRFDFLYPPEWAPAPGQYFRARRRLGEPTKLVLQIDYTKRTVRIGSTADAGPGVETYPLPQLTNSGQSHLLDWLRKSWSASRAEFLQHNDTLDSYDQRTFDVLSALFAQFQFYDHFLGTDDFPIVEIVPVENIAPDLRPQITEATSDEDVAYFVDETERALVPARTGNAVALHGAAEAWTADRDRQRDLIRERLAVVANLHREMETERDALIRRLGIWGDTSRRIGQLAALSHTTVQRIIAAGRRF